MHLSLLPALLAVGMLLGADAAVAQTAAPAASSAAAAEPRATEALQRMSRYLQSLQSFSVKGRSTTDHVLADGQKIKLDAATALWVRRPDRLRIDVTSDRRSRQFYYDGKTVTVYGTTSGYYAKVPAPPTLKELARVLADDYGLELPLADLYTWDADAKPEGLQGASAIGPATIRGVTCDHYAFRQEGLDWQVWIQRGEQPLPRRLVLTTTDDPAQPQHSVDLDWSVNDKPGASIFAFAPRKGAHQIPMRRADGSVASK